MTPRLLARHRNTVLLREPSTGNGDRVPRRVFGVGELEALPFFRYRVNQAELQTLFFCGALKVTNVGNSKNQFHRGSAFLRNSGLMQRNCASTRRAGQFKPAIRRAPKWPQSKEALVEIGDSGDIPDVEDDANDLR